MKLLSLLIISMLLTNLLPGQHIQFCDETTKQPKINDTTGLSFEFENFNFFKNNEFKNHFVEGYTKLGFFINPKVSWQIFPGTKITTGGHFLKFHGKKRLSSNLIFSVDQQLTEGVRLIMGSLDRSINHQLIDPLYHQELFINQHIENGVQFLIDKSFIEADVWIDWKKFIVKNDPFREHFVAGAQIKVPVWNKQKHFSLSIPLQFVAEHYGGQIDLSPDPATTEINAASGVRLEWFPNAPFLSKICWQSLWAGSQELTKTQKYPYNKGEAFYSEFSFRAKPFAGGMSYWKGSGFIPVRGNPLYSSISAFDASFISKKRDLMSGHLAVYREAKGIFLSLNVNGYYDLNYKDFDYSYSLYLLIDKNFKLKKLFN